MSHNVLITGNGFDLDIGYPTRYADFVNSRHWPLKEKDLSALGVPNLRNYIYDFTETNKDNLGNVKWIDIEQLLKEYALSKNKEGTYNEEIVLADEKCYDLIVSSFATYLREAILTAKTSSLGLKSSTKLIHAISKSSKEWIGYTFNYTDSSTIIDFVSKATENGSLKIPFTHLHVTHLHGKIDFDSLINHTLILGIDDGAHIPQEYKFLRKSWNTNYESHKMDEDLLQADDIICYGWSCGDIDREYFRDFLNEIKDVPGARGKKRGLHFIIYDEPARKSIMENLEAIEVSMSLLKKYTDLNFYLTSQKQNPIEVDRFKKLLDKISK